MSYSATYNNISLLLSRASIEERKTCYVFTGNDPRQGWRTPLNNIIYSEQRDEETGYGYFGARYMDHELMTMWLSVDPMSDKYPSLSPYNYCEWNPIRIVDHDGRDGWDRIAGFCIGIVTNVVPGTGGLRDAYTPTNSSDYNNALRTADNASMAVGGVMITACAAGMVAGNTIVATGAAVAATGVGAPEGTVVAVAGEAVDATAASIGLIGTTVTMQTASNSAQGYNRGRAKNLKDNSHNEKHGDGGEQKRNLKNKSNN